MPMTQYAASHASDLKLYPDRLNVLEGKLTDFISKGFYSSAAAGVCYKGVSIFEGQYGPQTPDEKSGPMRPDVIFPVASITKPVVAAILMKLQEDGEIDLSTPYVEYLPSHKKSGRDGILAYQLLTHTSGLYGDDDKFYKVIQEHATAKYGVKAPPEDAEDDAYDAFILEVRSKMGLSSSGDKEKDVDETWTKLQLEIPPKHKPDEVMAYCSYGYGLAFEIAQVVTGKSADQVAREYIFDPLKMADSHFKLPIEKYDRVARRGEKCEGFPWQNKSENFQSESGGGGMKTTINDILRFCEMVRQGGTLEGQRVLSRLTVDAMVRNINIERANTFDSWALGFNYRDNKIDDAGLVRPSSTLDHGGYGGSKIIIDRENGLSCALFTTKIDGTQSVFGRFMNMIYSAIE